MGLAVGRPSAPTVPLKPPPVYWRAIHVYPGLEILFIMRAHFLPHPAETPSGLPSEGWREVSLPHQWALEGMEAEVGWYRLELPAATGPRRWARLRADYFGRAWADERLLGAHEGYFEPWLLELPREPHTLWLRVAAPKEPYGTVWPRLKRQIKGIFGQHDCRPGGTTARGQERGTGGLWGGVTIFETGPVALLHLTHQTFRRPQGWRLRIQLTLDALAAGRAEVTFALRPENFEGPSLTTVRTLDLEAGRQTISLIWDLPELPRWEIWERGFPHLYRLEAALGDQQAAAPIGFRTLGQEGAWLLLNDRRVFLRGTNIIPTQWLAAYTPEDAARDVRLLRAANLNAVRVHAHLTHPAFYEACDREGILVWQDFPLQWGYADDEAFAQEAVRQAQAMVAHFGAHPSIFLWCAHNEPTHNRYTLAPLVAAAIRAADPTRSVKEASDFREHAYPGWYWGHMRDFQALPGAPLPSEFGAQALPRAELLRRVLGPDAWPPKWETWMYHNFQPEQTFRVAGVEMGESLEAFVENSQRYQARLIEFAIHTYRRAKGQITGYFHFMFVEPWEGITWAVLDVERVPKQGYFALQQASTPVLVSIVPYVERAGVGQPPLREVWVISDLDRPLSLRVSLRMEGPVAFPLGEMTVTLAPHEVRRVFEVMELFEAPLDQREALDAASAVLRQLPPGRYSVIAEAWEGERLWSRHVVEMEYLEPIGPQEEGFW